jgi:hypothetical protein
MDVAQFKAESWVNAKDEASSAPRLPNDQVKSVLVLAKEDRFSANPDDWILLAFPVNLARAPYASWANLAADALPVGTLLLNNDTGEVLATSPADSIIALRSGYFGEPEEEGQSRGMRWDKAQHVAQSME